MIDSKPTVETGTRRNAELDQEAGLALDALVEMARDRGVPIGPGEMMSRAIWLFYSVATGALVVTPSTEMDALAEGGPADGSRVH